MKETFGEDVVIVPSLGNNDIYRKYTSMYPRAWRISSIDVVLDARTAHNILVAGPNAVTNSFTE
jgi:hypothetical protein